MPHMMKYCIVFLLCVTMGVAISMDGTGIFQHDDDKDSDKYREQVAVSLDSTGELEASRVAKSFSSDVPSSPETIAKMKMVKQRSNTGPALFRKHSHIDERAILEVSADNERDVDKKYVSIGCYQNQGASRTNGHHSHMTVDGCAQKALGMNFDYFGMEYPEGSSAAGQAQCLPLQAIPSMAKFDDSGCGPEVNGYRLGAAHKLMVYQICATCATVKQACPVGYVYIGPGADETACSNSECDVHLSGGGAAGADLATCCQEEASTTTTKVVIVKSGLQPLTAPCILWLIFYWFM